MRSMHIVSHQAWRALHLLLWCGMVALAQASPSDSLVLDDTGARFDINSHPAASGFFSCAQGESIGPSKQSLTRPDFSKHDTYCFSIPLVSDVAQTTWVLHISQFYYKGIRIRLESKQHNFELVSDAQNTLEELRYNSLGLGFPLSIAPGRDYSLQVELSSDRLGQPPYIGLMTQTAYEQWSRDIKNVHMLALGMVLGFIVFGLLCGLVLKDMTFLWFAVSSFCVSGLFFISAQGTLLLEKNAHTFSSWSWPLVAVANISLLLFAKSFVSVDVQSHHLSRLFKVAISLCFAALFCSLFFSSVANSILYLVTGLLTITVILYSACNRIFDKDYYYFLFFLGWLPMLGILSEGIYYAFLIPAPGENTLSYENIREPFWQLLHMSIHMIAMLIRIVALKKAKYQAEMESSAKSQFLASVSHDLRQPLHSMGLYLGLLQGHVRTEPGLKIYDKVSSLRISIDDTFRSLMDLGRLEAGTAKCATEPVELDELIKQLAQEYEPLATEKGLSLRVRTARARVISDPLMLERIIRNLLSNAIKYTTRGGILIGLRSKANHWHIQIWDTGIGIREEVQQHLFDVYQRPGLAESKTTGAGIGLAIVKQLADLLMYQVSVSSQEGRGSCFQIVLPKNHQAVSELPSPLRIVLDLEPELEEPFVNLLEKWGYAYERLSNIVEPQFQSVNLVVCFATNTDRETALALVQQYKKAVGSVALVLLCPEIEEGNLHELKEHQVYALAHPLRPAQLRSLIRHVELTI